MRIFFRVAIAALAVGAVSVAGPVQAGLVMTISDNQGNTVTVNGSQPGGPGTDLVANFSGNLGGVTIAVSVGDSNSPSLTDPVRLSTNILVSGGTAPAGDIITVAVTDNGVTFPTGSNLTLTSSAATNPAGNATTTYQSSAAGTSTSVQTTNGVVSTPIAGTVSSPYTITGTTTLAFAAGTPSASVANALEVTAVPEPGSVIVWSLVACSLGLPGLNRRRQACGTS